MLSVVAGISAAIWVYLIFVRGSFWTGSMRDGAMPHSPRIWPSIAVVIPARNEADLIGSSVRSLLRQTYPGPLTINVDDDDSGDGTAVAARNAPKSENAVSRVTVDTSHGLPSGWTGKLWAVSKGIEIAEAQPIRPDYILLTDADIV